MIFALLALVAITLGYGWLSHQGTPAPGSLVGHGLGIVGFVLMLATETLYSFRKRVTRFPLGRMSLWLRLHIFTGLVGPYLVLLHSTWKFNGLAGVLTLMTLVVVVSGVIGRYIYTAVPRSLDGIEVAITDLEEQINEANRQLSELGIDPFEIPSEIRTKGWLLILGRHRVLWRQKRELRHLLRHLDKDDRPAVARLEALLAERHRLLMQIHSMEATRRLLALWHGFHVPLSGGLFALAFIHIVAALYYSTFLK